MKQITSLAELKTAATNKHGDYVDFFIVLGGGIARSSKRILYDSSNNTFSIINEIDDSYQDDLTEEQLKAETNIVAAIETNNLFQY